MPDPARCTLKPPAPTADHHHAAAAPNFSPEERAAVAPPLAYPLAYLRRAPAA